MRTKNDWSRRASGQKIGYLNSRTLRSVRLFFSPPHRAYWAGRTRGEIFPALTLPMLTGLEKHERSPLTIFRSGSHDCDVHASSHASPPQQFVPQLRGLPSAASASHILQRRPTTLPSARSKWAPTVPPPAHEKTRHSPRGRVSRRGGVECCRHATASPHRQFSTERACCSNRARSRSCAHRASACCRERVRGTCGGRTHRASQRRPCG